MSPATNRSRNRRYNPIINESQIPPYALRRGRSPILWILTAFSGPAGFLVSFYLEHAYEPRHSGAVANSLVFGVLVFILTDQVIERITAYEEREEALQRAANLETILRTCGSSMQRIEAALLVARDEKIFRCVEGISETYFQAVSLAARSGPGIFYKQRLERLLTYHDWSALAQQRIVYVDPTEELPIAKQLIELAEVTVDAIAVPNDMRYLASRTALASLNKQRELIQNGCVIRRILVFDSNNLAGPFALIKAIASGQAEAGVQVRIYSGDDDDSLPTPDRVVDLNIVDSSVVRRAQDSSSQLGDGLMTGVLLSEQADDIRSAKFYFERLWDSAYPWGEHPLVSNPQPRTTSGSAGSAGES